MNDIKVKLKEVTKRSDGEIAIINDVLNDHFIIGKNNQKKIIQDFINKLNIGYEEADELYNQCMEMKSLQFKFIL